MEELIAQLQAQVSQLVKELTDLRYELKRKTGLGSADIKGRIGLGSALPDNSVATSTLQALAVTTAKIAAAAVTQSKLSYEQVTLAFGSGDTSKTASVTSGSIVIGVHSSTVTSTPAYGELQLQVSGTTLTGTRSAAPGGAAAITYTITLLKA